MENNLTTLGKRENAVFILTPLYLVLFYIFRSFYLTDESGISLLFKAVYIIGVLVAIVAVLRFFRRLLLPSKIIQCDSMNLYINKGIKGSQIIPLNEIRSVDALVRKGNYEAIIDGIRAYAGLKKIWGMIVALWELSETGIVVINCKNELVRVHGIRNAREVGIEIHKILSSRRNNAESSLRLK